MGGPQELRIRSGEYQRGAVSGQWVPPVRNKLFRLLSTFGIRDLAARKGKESQNYFFNYYQKSSQSTDFEVSGSNKILFHSGTFLNESKCARRFCGNKGLLAGNDVESFYFILIQSQWPPQETPPSIGRRDGLLSSWPELLATRPEWKFPFLFQLMIINPGSGSGLKKK